MAEARRSRSIGRLRAPPRVARHLGAAALGLSLAIARGAPALAQYDATAARCLSAPAPTAADPCRRAFATDRANGPVAIKLAEALRYGGDADQAVRVLEQAQAAGASGADLAHALRLALSYRDEQRYQEEQAAARASDDSAVRLRVERIKCDTLGGRRALTACETALRLAPGDADLQARRAQLRASLGSGTGGGSGTAAARPAAPDPAPASAPAAPPATTDTDRPPPRPDHAALGPKPGSTAPETPDAAEAPEVADSPAPERPSADTETDTDVAIVPPTAVPAPAVTEDETEDRTAEASTAPAAPGPDTPATEAPAALGERPDAPDADTDPAAVAAVPSTPTEPDAPATEPEGTPIAPADTAPPPAQGPPPSPTQTEPPRSVIVLGGEGSGLPSPPTDPQTSIGAQLATLKSLRDQGLLTEEEFQAQRQAIFRRAFGRSPSDGGTGRNP
ncbi:hypothetical protein F1188_15050 [Roseospira marina]|uniref:SHOCT domain-containing protein n=1 Tax=Roseospira marina TaxID=140057 RepID=A0A5M6I8L6_9PROT|nr:SHOCT domain-containing protein [Roseospira marina]KAA5604533.1 hypothetical protein F1188_15050 [Roseospira marina]MBB4315276.1 hypothetical protein [Roseospira marina]MBB5088275.1 hypothetical protein [Roseospira marina]